MKNGIMVFMITIMCIGSFTLDWNLSKSAQILSKLTLHRKTKIQTKTKMKPHKIFGTLCNHFSLVKFCQVSYIIKKQTRTKNVLWMKKYLKNITLRWGYIGIISLEIFQVNIFQTFATQGLGYCLMGGKEKFHIKIGNMFFWQKHFCSILP